MMETAFAADLLLRRGGGAIFARWRDLVGQGAAVRHPARRPAVPDLARSVPRAAGLPPSARRSPGLGGEAAAFYERAVAPYWGRINAYLKADAGHRGRIFLGSGVEGLFGTLHTRAEWRPPVLELDNGLDEDIYPKGAGLTILPSLFLHGRPVVRTGPGSQGAALVLVYPVPLDAVTAAPLWDWPTHQGKALGALMGRTRAGILHALTESCTTTQLGRRLGISVAAASQHTTVLRAAGLVTSSRNLNTVLHSLTPLGLTLLNDGKGRGEALLERSGVS
ncbi:winged helix-turn-helix transcriptional regulator [Streptomyces samsunensis]|uniref:Winged helix-turn-helix transcriptional regulator n=1 Tax=Streptomyces malaysiensis TaxID=92644 RepID=A0ABX6WE48_STRMQ|nr:MULTISPECIES: winged helix-turn-helix domain-containing protein [Streptomyces]MCQ6248125.1 winged helix-turn-helix domain-containing protein [Streptomyces malaysiensis]NUH37626.1 winged helix-turn-helix transcriptional regulator [Streptomyces samsunensis]QDL69661.1 ArsR family transcriptional regulator [Streptomyces malaysiensis]QPI59710.1 winged helix-turn-helix transcriptional regulator [Streptomyces solisilvae]UHH21379.1 winged helix-turn-helix domain-containing protein [Streptomyces sp.